MNSKELEDQLPTLKDAILTIQVMHKIFIRVTEHLQDRS